MRKALRSCAVAAAVFLLSTRADGQTTVAGTVADSTGRPLTGVVISIAETAVSTVSDDAGRFSLPGVDIGTYIVQFRRLGVRAREIVVTIPATAGDEWTLGTIVLDPEPIDLPDIVAEEKAPTMSPRGMREFAQALRVGRGYFFTAADIERLRPFDVSDVIRRVPGPRSRHGWKHPHLPVHGGRPAPVIPNRELTPSTNPMADWRDAVLGVMFAP